MTTLTFCGARPQRLLTAIAALILAPLLSVEPAGAAALQYSDEAAMRFEVNRGQVDGAVDYVSRGQGYQVFLTKPGAVIVLQAAASRRERLSLTPAVRPEEPERSRTVVRMSVLGARPATTGIGDHPSGTANYLLGNDPTHWRTVPSWSRVRYADVYPGIDLIYYGNQRRLEYDFVVRPGADPRAIRLALSGSADGNPTPFFHAAADGSLALGGPAGEIRLRRPYLYQDIDGQRRPVSGAYVVHRSPAARPGEARVEVGFRVGAYDPTRPLVIDPVVDYSTYLGGSGNDAALAVAVDAAGNAYVAGYTESLDFPANPSQRRAGTEAFVAKLDAGGGALVYSTYLGGNGNDGATGIAVDASGAAYVTGYTTSTDFPVVNSYQTDQPGMDAFVARLTPSGSGLTYSTYLGGGADDAALAVAVDGSGNAHVTGWTASTNFPRVNSVHGDRAGVDVFAAKVNTGATGVASLVYSTYLGGAGDEEGHAIAIDAGGNAHVVGWTDSTNFPKVNAYHGDRAGRDAFVAIFPPSGAPLVYSSYLGGNGNDQALGVAVDSSGRTYVTGTTDSSNFPVLGALQPAPGGLADAFVAVINPAAAAAGTLVSSTYLGGTGNDVGHAITIDAQGRALVAGVTTSPDFPVRNPLHGPRGGTDAFVAKLDPFTAGASALTFSSYLGGTGDDMAHAIAVDSTNAAYVAGVTKSADFPAVGGVAGTAAGLEDGFLAKLSHLDEAGPDLTVTSVSTAATAAAGATLAIEDVTANEGETTAAATVTRFFLSTDQTLDSADVALGERNVPAIPGGETSTGTTSVTLPAAMAPGRYYVIAKANASSTVWEGDDENNTALTGAITVGPDLTVPAVLAPTNAGAGGTMVVGNTVKNEGAAEAPATTARFHLSTDTVLDAGDTLLGTRNVSALAPGALSMESTSLALPANLANGKYYVLVTVDPDLAIPEANEGNNTGVSTQVAVGPDLVVSSLTAPSAAAPGASITVTDRTNNQGGGPAGASTTTFYLSLDTTLDPADVVLGSRSVPALAAGANSQGSSVFTVPATVSGRFYIIAKANADGAVAEADSANNVRVSEQVRVGADLVVTHLAIPSTGGAGLTLSVTDTVRNEGTVSAGASTAKLFLSADAVLDASDVLLGSRAVPTLGVGAQSVATTSVTIPASTAPGRYYVIAQADADNAVLEMLEDNNTKAESLAVGPDLVVTVTKPPRASAGFPITIPETTRNRGGGAAAASTTRFYLSRNAVLDASDILLGVREVPALAPDATSDATTTFTVPVTATPGTYHLFAVADALTVVTETDETNNTTVSETLKIGADLAVDQLTAPVTATPGAPIVIADTIINREAHNAPSTVKFFLSSDATLDANDVLLGSRAVPTLGFLETSAATTTVTLPTGLGGGTHYLIAQVDPDNVVPEVDETNNVRVRQITVGADLVVWLDVPAGTVAAPGQTITVTDFTRNLSSAPAPPSTTRFFLSADATLDAGDVVLGNRAVPALEPNATSSMPNIFTIPLGLGGTYYLLAQADVDSAVTDSNRTNNTSTAVALVIGTDLVAWVELPSGSGRAMPGGTVTVLDTTKNDSQAPATASTTTIYLSQDTTLDANDVVLGTRAVPPLTPGASDTGSTTVTLPSTLTGGTYYVLAKADGPGVIPETNETNNAQGPARAVLVGADFIVGVDVPSSASAVAPGATVTVTDVTRNTSPLPAGASSTRFYLSADSVLDAGDTPIGTRAVPALAPFTEHSAQTAVTLPASVGGTFYLIAQANHDSAVAEIDRTNNTAVSAAIRVGTDLVAWVDLPAASAVTVPGATIPVIDYTKNESVAPAPASTTTLYLSQDATLDASDLVLGHRAVPPLAPGATDSGSTSVTLPATLTAGTYYIIAKADGPGVIPETNEENNARGPARPVLIGADLVISLDVPGSAAALAPGATITVSDITRNQGLAPAVASTTRFYLSGDPVLDASDVALASRAVPALASRTEHAAQTSLTLPAGVVGTFYVIARADADNAVTEVDKTNNTAVSAAMRVGTDLVAWLELPAGSAVTVPGATIPVIDYTKNESTVPAPASTTTLYFSQDAVLDAGDLVLGQRAVPPLAPGATDSGSTSVTLPATLTAGTYYIIAKADGPGVIPETNEENNARGPARPVLIGADLVISLDVPGSAAALAPGATITVSDVTRNQGLAPAVASTTRFHLSSDPVFDAADVALASRAVPALASRTEHAAQTSLTLPAGIVGTFYVIARADADNAVTEVDKTNNTAVSAAMRVGTDLVAWLELPAGSAVTVPGATIPVIDYTKNESSVPAPASTTTLYLSQDAVLDAGDLMLGNRAVPSLAPGITDSGSTSVTLPATLTAGTYYIIAKADGPGVIAETNEDNNARGPARSILIGADLVIALDVPGSAAALAPGATITVSDVTRNQGLAPAVASTTRFYLSGDPILDASDVVLASRAVPALASRTEHAAQTSLTMPAGLVGTFYVIARADADNAVTESDKTNNTAVSAAIHIGIDLVAWVELAAGSSRAAPGGTITITDFTKNESVAPAPASTTTLYLSQDTVLDAADVVLATRAIPPLAAGVTNSASTTVTLPATLAAGTYYVIGKADGPGVIAEINENNNAQGPARAVLVGADLVVTLDVPGSSWAVPVGGTVTVTDITRNNSPVTASASTTRFYLSTDTTLDASDRALGSRAVGALAADTEHAAQTALSLPAGFAGVFYVIAQADADNVVAEVNKTNNTAVSTVIKIGPDLIVALDVPAAAYIVAPGSTITVTDVTRNNSAIPASGSTVRFYASSDPVLSANDTLVGSRGVPALGAYTESRVQTALALPATLGGTFYLIARADDDGVVMELDESNNVAVSSAFSVGTDVTVFLDLPASASDAEAGGTISITDITRNGSSVAAPSSVTRFYLSRDTVLDETDVVLASRQVPALAPSGQSSVVTTLTLPTGITGVYYVIARADADNAIVEVDESNNVTASRAITIGPDLRVSLDVPGSALSTGSGATINVTDVTRNARPVPAAASVTRFHLSRDTVLDGTDVLLGSRSVPALAAFGESTAVTALTLPAGLAVGTHYVIARADADNAVLETDETNNVFVFHLPLTIGADLAVSLDLAGGSSLVAAGTTITVTDYTRNDGPATAGASTLMFYLSRDTVLDASDTLIGSRTVPSLGPGQTSTNTNQLTLPTGIAGFYYVLAWADAAGVVSELNEANNVSVTSALEIGPDLVITGLTAPAQAGAGATLYISDTTKNRGGGSAGGSTTRFYLSADGVLDGGDLLLGARTLQTLTPGAYHSATTTVAIPALGAGRYWLIAVADSLGSVVESNEGNNVWVQALDVLPDLTVTTVTAPSKAYPGSTITVGDVTANSGAGAPVSSTGIFLSADTILNGGDLLLAVRTVPGLNTGGTSSGEVSVALPIDLSAGTYYLIAVADVEGALAEVNEGNNTRYKSLTIGPDLTVTQLTAPSSVAAGATVVVSDSTKNLGSPAAASTTRYYLSADATLGAGDTLLGSRAVPTLGVGETSTVSVSLTIPASTSPGSYYVIAQSDGDAAIVELMETNNLKSRAITITP